ncbi:hypothetical protein [Methanolobus sp. WCC4]|uniref:hypothetical protein n=1 Tax=Methanolobus sp. WCC4 TaxID=3125784 RepID=UPI0030FB40CA
MSVVTAFAVFYVAAQAVERITESLISKICPGHDDAKAATKTADIRIDNLKKEIEKTHDNKKKDDLYNDIEKLLKDKTKFESKIVFRTLIIASTVGIIIAFLLNIRFLDLLEVSANPTIDTIVTGLTIGGGTKPLHDLIKYIEKSKT